MRSISRALNTTETIILNLWWSIFVTCQDLKGSLKFNFNDMIFFIETYQELWILLKYFTILWIEYPTSKSSDYRPQTFVSEHHFTTSYVQLNVCYWYLTLLLFHRVEPNIPGKGRYCMDLTPFKSVNRSCSDLTSERHIWIDFSENNNTTQSCKNICFLLKSDIIVQPFPGYSDTSLFSVLSEFLCLC